MNLRQRFRTPTWYGGFLAHGRGARRALWALAILFAAYSLLVYFAVPPLVKSQLESQLAALTGRPVTVGEVHANPYAMSLTVKRFDLRERDGGQSLFAFDELYVNIGLSTLWRLAPVVEELRLAGPRLRLVRNEDRRYNVQDLLDAAAAPAPADAKPFGFSLNNIQVSGGRVDFDDRPEGKRHTISDLHLGLPFISTLRYATDIKVQPFLAGTLNDAPFGLRGETTPFKDGSETVLRIDLDRIQLPKYLDYAPFELPLRVAEAELSANLVVNFTLREARPERIEVRGEGRLRRLVLQHASGAPLAQADEISVGLDSLDFVSRRAELRDIRVTGPQVRLRRTRDGALDLPALARRGQGVGAAASVPAPATTAPAEAPWQVSVGTFQVAGGAVEWRDESLARPARLRLQDVALTAHELSNAPNASANLVLAASDGAGAKLAYKGSLQATPLVSAGKAEITGFALRALQPYLESVAALELRDGVLDAATQIDATQQSGGGVDVKLSAGDATLRALRLHHAGEPEPFLRWAQFEVRGAAVDVPARRVGAGELALSDAALRLRREPDGSILLPRPAPAVPAAKPAAEATAGEATAARAAWRYLVEHIKVERAALRFEDRALREPAVQVLSQLALEARRIGNAPGSRGKLSLRTQVDGTGRLALSGEAGLVPPGARLKLEATTLPLAAADAYVAEQVAVRITSGGLSARGDLELDMPEGADAVVKYRGTASVTEFAAQEREGGAELQQWKSLRLAGLAFDSSVPSLALDEIALAGFYSRLLVHPDGQANLQKLVRERKSEPKPAPSAAAAASTPPPDGALAPRPPLQLRVGRVVLQDGTVDYTDLYIKPNVSARLLGVAGAVGEMNAQKAGEVELHASVDGGAPVEVLGRLNPFAKELELDLAAKARGIDLVPLTPYAGKYAGFAIDKGKLTLDLKYRVQQRKLAAQNHVVLDQFAFGAPVESPDATKLPVQLAVALLKDSNGVIDVNLPISGSLEDPQFSVGGLVLQALVNLIGKALTSPFALLGAMAGGGEELSYVEFAPGDAQLDAEDLRKLETLAKALANRPALRLEIAGRADPASDADGLRRAGVRRQVLAQKRRAQGGGAPDTGAPALSAEDYAKYLPEAYGAAKIPNKPRNFIGLAKEIPAAEMEALMLAAVPAGDAELRALAATRAQVTRDWLLAEGKVPAERVFLVAPRLGAEDLKGGGAPTRAEFSLAR